MAAQPYKMSNSDELCFTRVNILFGSNIMAYFSKAHSFDPRNYYDLKCTNVKKVIRYGAA